MTVSITKPTLGATSGWGTVLNTALDAIVTEVNSLGSGIFARLDASGRVAPYRSIRPDLPGQPVAYYGGFPNQSFTYGSAGGITHRGTFKLAVAVTDIRIAWHLGAYLLSSGETAAANAVPLKAAVEIGGTIYPVTFNGGATPTVDVWGRAVSDPIAVDLAAGSNIAVRTFINIASGQAYTFGGTAGTAPNQTSTGDGFIGSDVAYSGSVTTASGQSLFGPNLILGTPLAPTPVVGFVGDSIVTGTGDGGGGIYSWATRAIGGTLPLVRYSAGGVRADIMVSTVPRRGLPFLSTATHVVVMLGTNDLIAGRTAVQIEASLVTIGTWLVNRGIKPYLCTVLPRTTSTDSWATTANQTPTTGYGGSTSERGKLNAWIRTTPAPFVGFFETADLVETARDSGLWQVNGTANYGTADGTHPSTVLHTAMAAAIPTPASTFTLPA